MSPLPLPKYLERKLLAKAQEKGLSHEDFLVQLLADDEQQATTLNSVPLWEVFMHTAVDFMYVYRGAKNQNFELEHLIGAYYEVTGRHKSDLRSFDDWRSIVHPDDWLYVQSYFERWTQLSVVQTVNFRLRVSADDVRHVRVRNRSIQENGAMRLYGFVQDITREIDTYDALAESVKRFQILAENVPDTIYILSLHTQSITYMNKPMLLGYGFNEVEMGFWEKAIHPNDYPNFLAHQQQILQSNKDDVYELTYRAQHKDGHWEWIRSRERIIARDGYNKPQELLYTLTIVTEQINQQQRLVDQNRTLSALNRASVAFGATLDLDNILDVLLVQLADIVPYDSASITLQDGDYLRFAAQRGLPDGFDLDNTQFLIDSKDPYYEMREHATPQIIDDVMAYDGWLQLDNAPVVRSWMGVPLIYQKKLIGVLNVDKREPYAFSRQHADDALVITTQAAAAITNARLYQQLGEYADVLEDTVDERTAELIAAKSELESVLAHVADAIVYADTEQNILYVNPAWEQLTGYPLDDAMNMNVDDIIKSPDEQASEELHRTLSGGDIWQGKLRAITADKRELIVEAHIAPVQQDGEAMRVVGVVRDLSDAHRLNVLKDRLLTNAAHEFRTPVSILLTKLYIMRRRPDRMVEYLDDLEHVGQILKHLVENILDLSRLERGQIVLDKTTVDMNNLLQRIVKLHHEVAAQRKMSLQAVVPDTVYYADIDEKRITQILNNLISNAITYTQDGGEIVCSLQTDDTMLQIAVKDNGVGIPPEFLPDAIFEPFTRVTDGKTVGTGLGLSISREIARQHEGDITARSQLDAGSIFTLMLPLARLER